MKGITTKLYNCGDCYHVHQPTFNHEQQVVIFFDFVFTIITTNLCCYGGGHHVHQPALNPRQQLWFSLNVSLPSPGTTIPFHMHLHHRLELRFLFTLVLNTPTTSYFLFWYIFFRIGPSILLVSSSYCGVVVP